MTDRVSASANIVYIRSAWSARHGTGKAAHTEVRLQLLELLLAPVAPSRSHKHEQVHVLGVAHHRLLHLVLCGKGLDRGPPAADTQQFITIIRLAQVWISSLMLNKSVCLSHSLSLLPCSRSVRYSTARCVCVCARMCLCLCARAVGNLARQTLDSCYCGCVGVCGRAGVVGVRTRQLLSVFCLRSQQAGRGDAGPHLASARLR